MGRARPGRQLGEPGVRSSSGPKFEFGFSRDCAPRRCKAPVSVCQQCCCSRSRHLRIFFQPMFLGRSLGQLDREPALDDTHSAFSSLELLMSYLPRSIRQNAAAADPVPFACFPAVPVGQISLVNASRRSRPRKLCHAIWNYSWHILQEYSRAFKCCCNRSRLPSRASS